MPLPPSLLSAPLQVFWYVIASMPDGEFLAREAAPASGAPASLALSSATLSQQAATNRAAAGIAYVAASALAFGSLPIFARAAYASGVDTTTLLFLRFTAAAAVMWVMIAVRRAQLPRGRTLALLIGMGGIGYAGQAFSYFTALKFASAGLAALLLYLYPALVALLSKLVFRHPLSSVQTLAVATAFAGSALTVGDPGAGHPLGIALALLAALVYAAYILVGSRLPQSVSPTASAALVTTAAAAVYAMLAGLRGIHLPATVAGWAAVLALASVCTVVAIAFFFAGLERLGPVRASTYSTLEPMCTLVLAALFLGERITPARVLGGALILAAVVVLARADVPPAPDLSTTEQPQGRL